MPPQSEVDDLPDTIDVSDGRDITLSGTVFRKVNRDDSAVQEIFYMIRLDHPVTFTGLGDYGFDTYTTDEVKVGGASNFSGPDGVYVAPDDLVYEEWEARLGERVTCIGPIVGYVSPHWDYVNFFEERVIE